MTDPRYWCPHCEHCKEEEAYEREMEAQQSQEEEEKARQSQYENEQWQIEQDRLKDNQ